LSAQPTIGLKACATMVEAASKSCVASANAVAPGAIQATPDWNAIATGLAMQANAISVTAAVLAIFALITAIAWAIFVRKSAKDEARKAAEEEMKKEAPNIINQWLTTEGIAIMRQALQMAQPTPQPANAGDEPADAIAQNAEDQ